MKTPARPRSRGLYIFTGAASTPGGNCRRHSVGDPPHYIGGGRQRGAEVVELVVGHVHSRILNSVNGGICSINVLVTAAWRPVPRCTFKKRWMMTNDDICVHFPKAHTRQTPCRQARQAAKLASFRQTTNLAPGSGPGRRYAVRPSSLPHASSRPPSRDPSCNRHRNWLRFVKMTETGQCQQMPTFANNFEGLSASRTSKNQD
jgi:hypothetical protein